MHSLFFIEPVAPSRKMTPAYIQRLCRSGIGTECQAGSLLQGLCGLARTSRPTPSTTRKEHIRDKNADVSDIFTMMWHVYGVQVH